jgi:hypothetical protein
VEHHERPVGTEATDYFENVSGEIWTEHEYFARVITLKIIVNVQSKLYSVSYRFRSNPMLKRRGSDLEFHDKIVVQNNEGPCSDFGGVLATMLGSDSKTLQSNFLFPALGPQNRPCNDGRPAM